jgi:hypothetical protein
MQFRVVQLYALGVRRPRDELRADPGITGTVLVRDWADGCSEMRPVKIADVVRYAGLSSERPLLPRLFDVVLLRSTSKGVLLRGFEMVSEDGKLVQVIQEWWCSFPE